MIHISKDRVEFRYVSLDEKGNGVQKFTDVMAAQMGLISYLSYPVTIGEDVTVESVLKLLTKDKESIDFVFDSSLGGHPLQAFIDEMEACSRDKCSETIDHMEVIHDNDDVNQEDGYMFSTTRLMGVGKSGDIYSVEYSSLGMYMKIPLKLNKLFPVRILDEDGNEALVNVVKDFSLFEFIHAVLYEMSYHGTPDTRIKALEDMVEAMDLERKIEDNDIEKMESDLKLMVEREDYEGAARLRDRIQQVSRTNKSRGDISNNN